MLSNTRLADPTRDEVTCPFNAAHVIVASRLGRHLIRCAKNYPDVDKSKCCFNSDHIVPKHELEHHMANCPSRQIFETFSHRVGNSLCPVKDAVPIHVDVPDCGEDWDDVPVNSSPLEVIQETIHEKPIMRVLAVNGRTKSERKQFLLQETRRLRTLEEEKAKKEEKEQRRKEASKKEQPKVVTVAPDTPLRLPKTSKLGDSASKQTSAARRDKEVDELSKQMQRHQLMDHQTDDYDRDYPSGFDKGDIYMGGYSMPAPKPDEKPSKPSCYEDDCPESYEGRGYDVEYYGGYTGGYGGGEGEYGQFEEDDDEEVDEELYNSGGNTPMWLARGRKGKQDEGGRLKTVHDHNKQLTGIQSRLVQLKEVHRSANLKKQDELSVNVHHQTENSDKPKLSPTDSSCSSSSPPPIASSSSSNNHVNKEHFTCEVDEMGFLMNPIVGRGRGTRRF